MGNPATRGIRARPVVTGAVWKTCSRKTSSAQSHARQVLCVRAHRRGQRSRRSGSNPTKACASGDEIKLDRFRSGATKPKHTAVTFPSKNSRTIVGNTARGDLCRGVKAKNTNAVLGKFPPRTARRNSRTRGRRSSLGLKTCPREDTPLAPNRIPARRRIHKLVSQDIVDIRAAPVVRGNRDSFTCTGAGRGQRYRLLPPRYAPSRSTGDVNAHVVQQLRDFPVRTWPLDLEDRSERLH